MSAFVALRRMTAAAHRGGRPARSAVAGRGWPVSLALLVGGVPSVAPGAAFTPGAGPDPATGDTAAPLYGPAAAGEPLKATGFQWTLGPWRRAGVVALTTRWLRLEDGRSRQSQLFSDFDWANYLWQPWFVQLRFGLGLIGARDTASDSQGGSFGTNGLGLTGRIGVSVFPASRFPFELRAEAGDSRTGGDTLVGTVRSQRLSLSQSYRPESGNAGINVQLDYSRLQSEAGEDTLTSVSATARRQFGDHAVEAGASHAANRRSDSGDGASLSTLSLHHGFTPEGGLQVETLANWNEQQLHAGTGSAADTGVAVRQVSTVASWRPASAATYADAETDTGAAAASGAASVAPQEVLLPLQLVASARWVDARGGGPAGEQGAQAFSATLGATLELSRSWRLAGSMSGSRVDAGELPPVTTVAGSASIGWTPTSVALGAWRYAPAASGNVGASRSGATGERRQVGLQGSHSVSRDLPVGEGQALTLSLSQSVGVLTESHTAEAARALSHAFGLFWQASGSEGQQRFAGLSLSDSRSWAAGSGRFQLANLQLSQRTQVSRFTGWSANLTLQATRNQATEVDAFTGERRQDGEGWQHFFSGGASLEQQRLFGVPRLRHSLQLSLNSQQTERRAAGDIDAPRERISRSLESRIDYAIGRLDLRLSLRHAQVDGRAVNALSARLQRRL